MHAGQQLPGAVSTGGIAAGKEEQAAGEEGAAETGVFSFQDGPCLGADTDAVTNVKTMEDIQGDW